jgi:hypothetical protein
MVYLEWSAATELLAKSGQLSKGASVGVEALSETLSLAAAACLDYWDAECGLGQNETSGHSPHTRSDSPCKSMRKSHPPALVLHA